MVPRGEHRHQPQAQRWVTVDLVITRNGDIGASWWTPEVAEILCSLCGRKGKDCTWCVNRNPWCG